MKLTPTLPPTNAATLSADQLRWRYTVALSLIALLVIGSQVVVQFLIADQQYDSRIVNIAGRQRMLSQKLTKLTYYISHAESANAAGSASGYRNELAELLSLWERSHRGLQEGDAELGLPGKNSQEVIALFKEIQPYHTAMVAAAQSVIAGGSVTELERNIGSIKQNERAFLKGMNDIVFQYDREANAKVAFAKWLELGLMGITLLVLACEAAFIFAPATRRIQRDMQSLANREKDLELLFSVSPTAMLLFDKVDLTIHHANQKAMDLIGISSADIAKINLRTYVDSDYEANRHFLDKVSQGESLNEYEVILLDARRATLEALVSVRIIDFAGRAVLVLGITNISELKKAQHSLEHYATFDEMTGLLNRRTGLMMLGKSMARLRRDGGQLTVCFIDLDGLKRANDVYGHAEGDWLIRTVAETLAAQMRSSDAAVRLGGDEFLLILHDCSSENGAQLIARAEARLDEIRVSEGKPYPLAFSAGITTYAAEKEITPDELVSEADRLMYEVKQTKKRQQTAS